MQVSLEESFVKILKFLNGFEEEHIMKLAQTTAFMFSMGANDPYLDGPAIASLFGRVWSCVVVVWL